jgi:hypothetical protein
MYLWGSGGVDQMKVSKQLFRSEPLVNMTDDMVRLTIDMTRNEYHILHGLFVTLEEYLKLDSIVITHEKTSRRSLRNNLKIYMDELKELKEI